MLRRRQRGQALVGVLVVMILVFLLAGAVSIGASALMARMGNHGQAVAEDFAAQSAVAAAASYAASPTSTCVGNIVDFTVAQPSPAAQAGRCAGLGAVPLNSLTTKDLGPWSGDCSATNLTSYQNTNLVIFFNARWLAPSIPAHTMSAYIDKFQASTPDPCSSNPAPGNTPCSAAPKSGVSPLVFACNLGVPPTGTLWYLIVRNGAAQPRQVFFLSYTSPGIQNNTGTLYVTVAGTGLPTPRDYEQAIFYSPSKGASLQLLYEAQLP